MEHFAKVAAQLAAHRSAHEIMVRALRASIEALQRTAPESAPGVRQSLREAIQGWRGEFLTFVSPEDGLSEALTDVSNRTMRNTLAELLAPIEKELGA